MCIFPPLLIWSLLGQVLYNVICCSESEKKVTILLTRKRSQRFFYWEVHIKQFQACNYFKINSQSSSSVLYYYDSVSVFVTKCYLLSFLFCLFLLPWRKFNVTLRWTKTFQHPLNFKYHLFEILTNFWTLAKSKGVDFRGKWTHQWKIKGLLHYNTSSASNQSWYLY